MARTRKGGGTPVDRSADANRIMSGKFEGMTRAEVIDRFKGTTKARHKRIAEEVASSQPVSESGDLKITDMDLSAHNPEWEKTKGWTRQNPETGSFEPAPYWSARKSIFEEVAPLVKEQQNKSREN